MISCVSTGSLHFYCGSLSTSFEPNILGGTNEQAELAADRRTKVTDWRRTTPGSKSGTN